MRLSIHRPRAARLRVAVAGLTGSALIAAAFTGATAPASAAGLNLLESTTSIGGQPSDDGNTIAVSVTVTPALKLPNLNLGLKVAPTGTVTFSDDQGDNLGAVTLPACLLSSCTANATINASDVSDGVTYITASYPGDLVLKPSVGAFAYAKSGCSGDDECDAQVDGGTTTLDVSSDDSESENAYVDASLGGPGLPCSLGVSAVANFDGHNLDSRKYVTYTVTGAAADDYDAAGGEGAYACWVSPNAFTAYSPVGGPTSFTGTPSDYDGGLGDAPQIVGGPYNGDYVGLLAFCPELGSFDTSPCITNHDYEAANSEDPTPFWYVTVSAPPGDPHMGG